MTLSILLATRGRPHLLSGTVSATVANMARSDTKLVIACDYDDEGSISVACTLQSMYGAVEVSIRPREDTLGAKYNRLLEEAPADVFLAMVDYAPHITPGFDQKILDAAALFQDGYGIVYNHMANLSFPQINAVTAKLAGAMGFIYPPYFPYWFIDHWLDDVARMIGRIAIADIWIDVSKRPGTQEMREPAFWATLYDAFAVDRRRCAADLIRSEDFVETEARKRLLLQSHPLIEERSQMINNNVRADGAAWAKQLGDLKPDERYHRVKAAAREHLKRLIPELEAEDATRRINAAVAA